MAARLEGLLTKLESQYGRQEAHWPVEPYDFLVWWHCGYPASDTTCAKGWHALNRALQSIRPADILAAGVAALTPPLRAGGMVPELRALRLLEIAERVQRDFGGDLSAGLKGPVAQVQKTLQKFPNIAGPGSERILLFAGLAPLPAIPSNCPHVLVRIRRGHERENYGVTYKQAQEIVDAETPATFDSRTRAYLLLKMHGQQFCKRTKPKCDPCPVKSQCKYYAAARLARDTSL
jgi:endonuclease III